MDTAAYLREAVTVLSQDVGVRSFQDMRKIEEAEHYISSEFNSFGYHITRQPFYFFGNTSYLVPVKMKYDSAFIS